MQFFIVKYLFPNISSTLFQTSSVERGVYCLNNKKPKFWYNYNYIKNYKNSYREENIKYLQLDPLGEHGFTDISMFVD